MKAGTLLLLGLSLSSTGAQNCWWTACQLNRWEVTGCPQCFTEKSRDSCSDSGFPGNQFECCDKEQSPDPLADYSQISKALTNNGYPPPVKRQADNFNSFASKRGKITTKQEAAMALAQILHESAGFQAMREFTCAKSQCPGKYPSAGCDSPGQTYYGRGYIQLRGCYNYRDASLAIFGDTRLVTNPDQVASNDTLAWETAFWFWGARVHDKEGVQQGKFGASTKAITGGAECYPQRLQIYKVVRRAFGFADDGDPSGC